MLKIILIDLGFEIQLECISFNSIIKKEIKVKES